MSVTGGPSSQRRDVGDEERIEVRRYLAAVRRNVGLIAAIVVLVTGAVVAISLRLPPTYQSQAKILVEEPVGVLGSGDAATMERRLATTRQLLTARRILDAAGTRLGVDGDFLGGSVQASIDAQANIINVVGQAETPGRAAAIANTVAEAFLADRSTLVRQRIAAARQTVQQQIEELSQRSQGGPEVEALRERLAELSIAESAVGVDLQIVERAEPPAAATSPRPLRNGVLALFASAFFGVLVALGRDQLTPRASGPRELSRILELPLLAGVPYVRRRWQRSKARNIAMEHEAYQTLRAALEFSAWGDDDRVMLVSSALAGEGKSTATARLGRALARAGHRTLIISADLRMPRLHEEFGLSRGVGLGEILTALNGDSTADMSPELFSRARKVVLAPSSGEPGAGFLHMITSGTKVKDTERLVSGAAMRTFLSEVRRMDYDYIVMDSPPLLGLADAQALAQWSDTMLVVARLDLITLDHASELRAVLDRLPTRALGLVVIGAQGGVGPYYLARRPAAASGGPGVSA